MKNKPNFFKLLTVELQNLFLIIISFVFFITMLVGLLTKETAFVGMTINESKLLLLCFSLFILMLPWPFVFIRYCRLLYTCKNGVLLKASILNTVNMFSPYVHLEYKFNLNNIMYSHSIDLMLTDDVKDILKRNNNLDIVFDSNKNRSFIASLYYNDQDI